VYSLGLAVPFLLTAVAIERVISLVQRHHARMAWISRISGVLLIAVGVLLVSGYLTVLTGLLQKFTPAALRGRL
jgi:cytochrome c-type biogenesis protein